MDRKLIFLDVDGTLTRPGSNEVPPSALAAIRAARRAGHRVFLCSGRSLGMLAPLLSLGFDGVVASAGGYVLCGEELLFDCPMTERQRTVALRLMAENGVFRTLEARDACYCDEGVRDFLAVQCGGGSEVLRWRSALEKELGIRPMAEYDGRALYKIVFHCEREAQLAPVIAALGEEFCFQLQEDETYRYCHGEIINRRFDKGRAVCRVARRLGVALADTVGFGDSRNDLEMLRTVGLGVCMGGGSPALRAVSRMVCPAVEEDGLAAAFRELGLSAQA